ncbi:MAG: PhoU domain-containing protein [Acidimicrobiales bacterium]|nr:PhoU domain-containing protein [Acidimicrobiales bacterium]
MSFFKKSESGLDVIAHRTISMLADARHSFDLASAAVLSGADPESVAEDIRTTDERINKAEQTLRGDLVTHVAVHGSTDIGSVLSYTLLIKKIERIGDQAKNILDLAEEGVSLVGENDISELIEVRRAISSMFSEAADLMAETTRDEAQDFYKRATELRYSIESKIRDYMHSDEPGSYAVPRAVLYRYWKRIVANLAGVVTGVTEPLQNQGYTDDGQTDLDD